MILQYLLSLFCLYMYFIFHFQPVCVDVCIYHALVKDYLLACLQSQRVVTNDNGGYLHRDTVMATDEPPPPYTSSVSSSTPEQSVVGLSRDRRTGRSLPPTPSRPPPPHGGSIQPHDSLSEHIYDEPSTLFGGGEAAVRPDTRPMPTTLAANPRSSMSRIRLGTTALRPGGTLRSQSPVSVSRHRPRGFGTHQPRRSMYLGPQISEPVDGAALQPFFISNFAPSPTDLVHGSGVMRDVNPSGRMLAYATGTPSMSPQQTSIDLRPGVYDEPWDSSAVVDRVTIPLTAMPAPPRSAATLSSSRRRAAGWQPPGLTHREARLSDWPGPAGHSEVFPGTYYYVLVSVIIIAIIFITYL